MARWRRIPYRLHRMSFATALVMSLPLLVLVAWYAWSAWAQLDRYQRAFGEHKASDDGLFQLVLHDELHRDLRRLLLPARPADSDLPVYAFSLATEDLDALTAQADPNAERKYVKGFLQKDGVVRPVRLRYRGSRHWHWLMPQKSMKVRLDKGDLLAGTRVFNLINDVTPFGLEEEIVLDLAREQGLLTPEYHAAWVRMNNVDMGVYRYSAQPTEGLLRRARRMPGSIYSGNVEEVPGDNGVFTDLTGWQKVASRNAASEADVTELERLLRAVNEDGYANFVSYVDRELDLPTFATFDALDVVFGGDQHDYLSNHKLYFDPYRGRFEPIAWNFRGFKHEEAFNLVDHPLLTRLKSHPNYLTERDRRVYELLVGDASVPNVRARASAAFDRLAGDFRADPYWDAYKLLPRASRFHRFMVRPMSRSRWLTAAEAELHGFGERSRFLLDALEQPGLQVALHETAGGPMLWITVDGYAAYELHKSATEGDCAAELYADIDFDRVRTDADPLVTAGSLSTLTPGVALVQRQDARPKRGDERTTRAPRTYRYFVGDPGCTVEAVTVDLENLITGAPAHRRARVTPEPPIATAPPDPRFPHRWSLGAPPPAATVQWGPGTLRMRSETFEAHQTVRIAPGTRIELEPGASLIFHGQLVAEGTAADPIVITNAGDAPFGGVLLQGEGTAGSVLKNVRVGGGTAAGHPSVDAPGMLNVHDTRDILLEDVALSKGRDADDMLHVTYVDGLTVHGLTVTDAPMDAVDIEFSRAELQGLWVIGPGDECLDLMGATVRLVDSVLMGCTNNAVSAGEETELTGHGLLIARADVGVLAKNASSARLTRTLIYDTGTALRTNRRDVHYEGESSIGAQELFAVKCDRLDKRGKGTRIDHGRVQRALPYGNSLSALLHGVLRLESWDQLDGLVSKLSPERTLD